MSVNVNPEILIWARETAGLDLEEAASKLGFSNSVKSSAIEKLAALEAGNRHPTRNQISAFSRVYSRPLSVFYLAKPPSKGDRGEDFRQTPDARGRRENAMLDALLRNVKARQEMVRDLVADDDDHPKPDFVRSISIHENVQEVAKKISERLGFDHTDISLRRGGPTSLFSRLRDNVENSGVFVLILGDLGSYHSAIPASVFRGFAIADEIAPFIVINAKDARPARSFTLIHEFVHIWLGQTGVSGSISTSQPGNNKARIERFCNDVAGEFLLPELTFRDAAVDFKPDDFDGASACIELVAQRWSVSEPMVAYRFQRMGDLDVATYDLLRAEYDRRWRANLAREREGDGGPSGHVIRQYNLGSALVDIVYRGFKEKSLTHTKAATLLGSKAISVPGFISFVEDRRRARNPDHLGAG